MCESACVADAGLGAPEPRLERAATSAGTYGVLLELVTECVPHRCQLCEQTLVLGLGVLLLGARLGQLILQLSEPIRGFALLFQLGELAIRMLEL